MKIAVRISEATTKDLPEMYKIEIASYDTPWPREMFYLDYLFDGKAHYYVAKWMKKIVGFLGVWNEQDKLHIVNIAVHPSYRKRGVGSQLMEFAISLAKKGKKREIYLEVKQSNKVAQKLYKKFGFTENGKIPNYYIDGEDGIIMRRSLNEYSGN
jgi:ribosomal-protein-alanine N-acetyltransferase